MMNFWTGTTSSGGAGTTRFNRELCLALRAETLVPDGEPQANDKFLEFRKDKLRFGYGKKHIRRSPDAPDLREIGAAAEGFMAALFSTPLRSIAPKTRRCLPDQETSCSA
jgi:hypothetical protein